MDIQGVIKNMDLQSSKLVWAWDIHQIPCLTLFTTLATHSTRHFGRLQIILGVIFRSSYMMSLSPIMVRWLKTEDSLEIANGQPHLRIRSVMRMQGVTSVALAERLGISKVGVSVMLKSNNPTVERLIQIADALGVCVTDLFSYDENEN